MYSGNCTSCDVGYFKPAVCTACRDAEECAACYASHWAAQCAPCQPCAPGADLHGCGGADGGAYLPSGAARAAGATSPGECVACRKGFFKDEEYAWDTMCEPCQPCAAGEYRADCGWGRAGECTACPTGTHKTEGLAGSAWDTKCDRCEPCPAGKKRVGCGLESAGTCDDCEAGTYKDGAYFWDFGSAGANSGLPLDQAAKLGRLAAPTKSGGECSRCMPCPPGSYLDGCGGASAGSCVQCPAGEFKPEGLEEGPSGWDTPCTPLAACPAGQYRLGFAGLGTTYAGVAAVVGSSTDGQCVDCPAGTYKDAAGSWDTPCVDCAACDAGEYRQGCGLASAGSCVACPDGMYKTDSHSGLCVDCQPCVAGAYLPPSTA